MSSPFDLLTNGLKQYVVAPAAAFGVGGFVFDVEGDTTVNLSTEITDHYLEDNSSVQDHISIRPKRIVLRRYVGELVDHPDQGVLSTVQSLTQKLTALSSFLPTLSKGAEQIYNLKSQNLSFGNIKNTISNLSVNGLSDYWAFSKNLLGQENAQQRAYTYLKSLMEQRILCGVQTPFEFLNNMAIESIVGIQPEGSKYISDFTITFKQIRFAQLLTAPAGAVTTVTAGEVGTPTPDQAAPPVMQGKASAQNEPLQNNGVVNGTAVKMPTDADLIMNAKYPLKPVRVGYGG